MKDHQEASEEFLKRAKQFNGDFDFFGSGRERRQNERRKQVERMKAELDEKQKGVTVISTL